MINVNDFVKVPHVTKVLDIGLGDGIEVFHCESLDGEKYEMDLIGSDIEGRAFNIVMGGDSDNPAGTPFYAEFGRELEGSIYISGRELTGRVYMEPVFTSDEFVKIPEHADIFDTQSLESYKLWESDHSVPPSICPKGLPLYYGYSGAIFRPHVELYNAERDSGLDGVVVFLHNGTSYRIEAESNPMVVFLFKSLIKSFNDEADSLVIPVATNVEGETFNELVVSKIDIKRIDIEAFKG